MKIQPYIACFIILEKDNQILIAQRAWDVFLSWSYNFPSGHLETWETLQQATIREAKEEIWITIYESDISLKHTLYWQSIERPYIYFYRHTTKRDWEPHILETDKCSDLRWISYNDIEKYQRTPWDLQAIKAIQQWIQVSTYNANS